MRRAYVLLAVPLAVLPGCQMNEKMTGAVGGAAAGGLIAAVTGASAGTVVVLVGVGALAGYLVGDYIADQRCGCGEAAPPPCGCCAPASEVKIVPVLPDARAPRSPESGSSWNARV